MLDVERLRERSARTDITLVGRIEHLLLLGVPASGTFFQLVATLQDQFSLVERGSVVRSGGVFTRYTRRRRYRKLFDLV